MAPSPLTVRIHFFEVLAQSIYLLFSSSFAFFLSPFFAVPVKVLYFVLTTLARHVTVYLIFTFTLSPSP